MLASMPEMIGEGEQRMKHGVQACVCRALVEEELAVEAGEVGGRRVLVDFREGKGRSEDLEPVPETVM